MTILDTKRNLLVGAKLLQRIAEASNPLEESLKSLFSFPLPLGRGKKTNSKSLNLKNDRDLGRFLSVLVV